jgi:hypothetical protein
MTHRSDDSKGKIYSYRKGVRASDQTLFMISQLFSRNLFVLCVLANEQEMGQQQQQSIEKRNKTCIDLFSTSRQSL